MIAPMLSRFSLIQLAGSLLWSSLAVCANAQYNDNLQDISTTRYRVLRYSPLNLGATRLPTPIGNLGDPKVVIDLRGFVPMSLLSTSAFFHRPFALVDVLDWFKIPTKKALMMLYFGNVRLEDITGDTTQLETQIFNRVRFLTESDVRDETAFWSNLSYDLAKDSAPMFERVAGSGFESAEPVTVLLTDHSAFVILSMRYSSSLVSHGQVLCALEFSRSSKRYKVFYNLYSTAVMSKANSQLAAATAPYVAKALIEAGVHAVTGQ